MENCARMLKIALDIGWKVHIANTSLFNNLPRITNKIAAHGVGTLVTPTVIQSCQDVEL